MHKKTLTALAAAALITVTAAPANAAVTSKSRFCGTAPCIALTSQGVQYREPGRQNVLHHPAALRVIANRLPDCRVEDGSGQSACHWDASTSGNHAGESFIAIYGGTSKAAYHYLADGHVEK